MSDPPLASLAPAKREEIEQIRAEHQHISAIPHLQELLDAFPTPAVILNERRQIVAANQRLCRLLDRREDEVLGMRIGEAFNCIHWPEGNRGCGTSQFCETCGALQAILNSQQRGGEDIQECTITLRADEGERALDLRVTASNLDLGGKFTVFALADISDEKRRAVLERMFFHDVLNTTAGVRNLLEVLPALPDQYRQETTQLAFQLVQYLIEEIEAGKDLAAAERGELAVHIAPLDAQEILKSVCELYANHPVSQGKAVVVREISGPGVLSSDKVLLKRVLGNLVKNALEASLEGQKVSLDFQNQGAAVFRVHNEAAMPELVRLQVFRRSFSTKALVGRGIGTYSAKLITEHYLGGSLTFTSSEGEGTTFVVTLPALNPV
ncbi:MAG TPA: PAS domain-containing sensor histidine kinase [Terriglobia bacterium]|nr:PAS domain-containing sensor histidine kinase [Terriglobia bacterium]